MAIVLKGAKLVDGTGRPSVENGVICINGRHIHAVGREGSVDIDWDGATVIDVEGRTVLPALMDLHAGITALAPAEVPQGLTAKNIAASVLRGAAIGRHLLDLGITTVRVDMGHQGTFALKEAFASGVLPGPRLIVPGQAIGMTGGHGWDIGTREADGADGVRRAAREELKAGADWIKLMATGGAGSPNERTEDVQLTVEELRAAAEEAHKKGKFAYAHVTCADGARNCIAAGLDSIEHGLVLEEDIVQGMKNKGIFLIPTLMGYREVVERGEKGEVPEYLYRKCLKVVDGHARSFRMALEAGVKIALGTDSGYFGYPMGEAVFREMEALNGEGMSPMEVIISATSRAAECLRMASELGTLEAGKLADVLVVEGDPLASITALRNTWMVLKEGEVVFRREAGTGQR